MPTMNAQKPNTQDPTLPRGVEFRFWTRAELVVSGSCITFEGRAAVLMRELLNNHGKRVPASLLWVSMISDGGPIPETSIEEAVCDEVKRLIYRLGTMGIVLAIDLPDPMENRPGDGFMLSAVTMVEPPRRPSLVRARKRTSRLSQTPPQTLPGNPDVQRKTNCDPKDVAYAFPGRLEDRQRMSEGTVAGHGLSRHQTHRRSSEENTK